MSTNIDTEISARARELLGVNIKKERIRLNLSQLQMAEILGIARTSISNIEHGRQYISAFHAVLLRDKLGIDLNTLFPSLSDINKAEKPTFKKNITFKEVSATKIRQMLKAKSKYERLQKEVELKKDYCSCFMPVFNSSDTFSTCKQCHLKNNLIVP